MVVNMKVLTNSLVLTVIMTILIISCGAGKPRLSETQIGLLNETGKSILRIEIRVSDRGSFETLNFGNDRKAFKNRSYFVYNHNVLINAGATINEIRIVDIDGQSFMKRNVNLPVSRIITFNQTDSVIEIPILNNTRETITEINIKPTGTLQWSSNLISSSVRSGQNVSIPISTNDLNNRFDIRLREGSCCTFIKTNLFIERGRQITFTQDDLR